MSFFCTPLHIFTQYENIFYDWPPKYPRSDDENCSNINQDTIENQHLKLSWKKCWVFLVLVLNNGLTYCTFILAYKQAVTIDMNLGVLTCFLSLKPAILAFLFWLIFRQSLRWVDILGIFLLISSIIFMSLKIDFSESNENIESSSNSSYYNIVGDNIVFSRLYAIAFTIFLLKYLINYYF